VVKEEEAVLIALVRRNYCAVGPAVRRAMDDEVPGAVEEEAGPDAVRRVPPRPSGCIFRFSLVSPRSHFDHTRETKDCCPYEQPGWAIHMRARKKQAFAKVEMPYAGPSGIAAGEVLWGSTRPRWVHTSSPDPALT